LVCFLEEFVSCDRYKSKTKKETKEKEKAMAFTRNRNDRNTTGTLLSITTTVVFVLASTLLLEDVDAFQVASHPNRRYNAATKLFMDNNSQHQPSKSTSQSQSRSRSKKNLNTGIRVEKFKTKSNDKNSWIADSFEIKEDRSRNAIVGPHEVLIYDTTLRDGTQGESISASCDDKLKISKKLAAFDVDYIEAGWPGSNPKDAEFFHRAKQELTAQERSKLTAFGSTRRKYKNVEEDKQVQALLDSEAPTLCIVAKSHAWQVTDILGCTKEENLNMIHDTVSYLVHQHHKRVFIDLEHFFDGYKNDPDYAMKCAETAADAGASALVLCDTNGGTMPWEIQTICTSVVQYFDKSVTIGIHAHNDCGLAVSNSLCATHVGVGMIQGTTNGIGERTGNANLCSIIPTLGLHNMGNNDDGEKVEVKMTCKDKMSELTKLSRFVDETLNRTPESGAPYVGSSAFAHKGGLHVSAMEKSPLSYQHIHPELVGNKKRVLISELSGRQNIKTAMEEANNLLSSKKKGDTTTNSDTNIDELNAQTLAILQHVKKLENQGYTFEGADASVQLMILHSMGTYCTPFKVLDYSAHVYDSNMDSFARIITKAALEDSNNKDNGTRAKGGSTARATVKVRTLKKQDKDDEKSMEYFNDELQVSDGNGPVDALYKALTLSLTPTYPNLKNIELIDYKVRILDPESATSAITRVMIEFRDSATQKKWTTVSVDKNVISASLNALIDGFEYALILDAADHNNDHEDDSCILFDDWE